MGKTLSSVLFLTSLVALPVVNAQSWDTSGNILLNGTYHFRQVVYRGTSNASVIGQAVSLYGTIVFDGNGNYSINGTVIGYVSPPLQSATINGTYSISASGYGFLSSPVSEGDFVYGLVSKGIFIGSSTENGYYNDLFVAVASGGSTNPSFQGSYIGGYLNLISSSPFDGVVQFNPDGRGNLGALGLTAYQPAPSSTASSSQNGVTYAINNGIVSAAFPAEGNLNITGQQLWYVSPDGSFFAGGSATGWDMIIGFRTGAATSAPLTGVYYQAGLAQDESKDASQASLNLTSYYGSLVARNGTIVGHRRLLSAADGFAQDITYSDTYPQNFTFQYTNDSTATTYAVSSDGSLCIGFGTGRILGLSVSTRAPDFQGDGVYLNPVGIQNSASSAPFTANIAQGELILLNGTNLADTPVVSTSPFPPDLGGVQVFMNNIPAPLYYVTPSLIATVVPYEIVTPVVEIQVVKGGDASNVITAFVGATAPGVFTNPPGGVGQALIQHSDYSLVTPDNPAQPGETVLCYLTGTGAILPTVPDGEAGPIFPLSTTVADIGVKIDGASATVIYSGLAPTLSGMYALVFAVPNQAQPGDARLEIDGPDASSIQAHISIGSGAP